MGERAAFNDGRSTVSILYLICPPLRLHFLQVNQFFTVGRSAGGRSTRRNNNFYGPVLSFQAPAIVLLLFWKLALSRNQFAAFLSGRTARLSAKILRELNCNFVSNRLVNNVTTNLLKFCLIADRAGTWKGFVLALPGIHFASLDSIADVLMRRTELGVRQNLLYTRLRYLKVVITKRS